MADDLIRLMHALFLPAAGTLREAYWRPSADVYRRDDGWLVKFDLAGVRLEDLTVSVRGRVLIVRGCRRDQYVEKGLAHHSMEIAYSQFERRLELPCDLESARIASEYRDGMLLIRIQTETQS